MSQPARRVVARHTKFSYDGIRINSDGYVQIYKNYPDYVSCICYFSDN